MAENTGRRIERPADSNRRTGKQHAAVRPHKLTANAQPAPTQPAQTQTTSTAKVEQIIQSFMKTLPGGSMSDVLWGSKVAKKEEAARKYFGIPKGDAVWLILDTTLFGSCKVGFALCTSGMHAHDERGKDAHLSWQKVAKATLETDGGTLVVDGNRFVASGEADDLMQLFRRIQKELVS